MNCLSYALPLWHKHGGLLQLRKSKHLDIAHVIWVGPDGSVRHYVPKVSHSKSWRHLFITCVGFDGEVRTSDEVVPEPISLRGLLLSACIFAFVVTWFCIKELFIRLVKVINMKQFFIAMDQTVNTLVWAEDEGFGMADETLSARMWRLGALEGRRSWAKAMKIADAIFFWDKSINLDGVVTGHCEMSFASELERKHFPDRYHA